MPRSRQIRDLAIAGARALAGEPVTEEERDRLLRELTAVFDGSSDLDIDWDVLREKQDAWPDRWP